MARRTRRKYIENGPCKKACKNMAAEGHLLCEKHLAEARKYAKKRLKDPKVRKAQSKRSQEYRIELRTQILNKYGWQCSVCGFSDERALQLDHVNGKGNQERKKTGGSSHAVYRKALEDNTGQYQILCANCNFIKRFEEKEGMIGRAIIRPPNITGCSDALPDRQPAPIQGQDSCGGQPESEQVMGVLVDGISVSAGQAPI